MTGCLALVTSTKLEKNAGMSLVLGSCKHLDCINKQFHTSVHHKVMNNLDIMIYISSMEGHEGTLNL